MVDMKLQYLYQDYEQVLYIGDNVTNNLLQVKLKQVAGYHLLRALSLNELLHSNREVPYFEGQQITDIQKEISRLCHLAYINAIKP